MASRNISSVTKMVIRSIHKSRPLQEDARLANIKKWQKHFQQPDGVPVYLKRGTSDRILFGIICIGTAVGTVNSLTFLYEEVKKP